MLCQCQRRKKSLSVKMSPAVKHAKVLMPVPVAAHLPHIRGVPVHDAHGVQADVGANKDKLVVANVREGCAREEALVVHVHANQDAIALLKGGHNGGAIALAIATAAAGLRPTRVAAVSNLRQGREGARGPVGGLIVAVLPIGVSSDEA